MLPWPEAGPEAEPPAAEELERRPGMAIIRPMEKAPPDRPLMSQHETGTSRTTRRNSRSFSWACEGRIGPQHVEDDLSLDPQHVQCDRAPQFRQSGLQLPLPAQADLPDILPPQPSQLPTCGRVVARLEPNVKMGASNLTGAEVASLKDEGICDE